MVTYAEAASRETNRGRRGTGTWGWRKWTRRTVHSLELLDSFFFFFPPWAGITYEKLIHYLTSKYKTTNYAKTAMENPTARKLGSEVRMGSTWCQGTSGVSRPQFDMRGEPLSQASPGPTPPHKSHILENSSVRWMGEGSGQPLAT